MRWHGLKSIIRWLLLGVITLIGIFLLSNSRQLFLSVHPDQITVMVNTSISVSKVSEMLPGSKVLNEKTGLLEIPYGKITEYPGTAMTIKGVLRATIVPLDKPIISWRYYSYSVTVDKGFLHRNIDNSVIPHAQRGSDKRK